MTWRERGYIWGASRAVLADASVPLDLVSLPSFDEPRPFRIDLLAPTITVVTYEAELGRGDSRAEIVPLSFNAATKRGSHIVYASSVRVRARYASGTVAPGTNLAAAWATPVADGGLVASRPRPFAVTPAVASQPQAVLSAPMVGAGARRRLTIANYQGAGTANLLLASARAATAVDFDIIVPPNTTYIEEADDGALFGVWDAAGAGFARIATWSD